MTERFHVDVIVAGLISSLYFLAGAVSGPIAGAIADRVGRRPVILAAVGADTLLVVALGLAPTVEIVAAAVIGAGLFGAAAQPTIQAVVADVMPPERRGVVYGSMYQALGVGFFIGPVLATPLLATTGYTGAFAVAAVTYGLTFVLFAARLPETLSSAVRGPRAGHGTLPLATAGESREAGAMDAVTDEPGPGQTDAADEQHATSAAAWWRDRRLLLYVGLHVATFGAYIELFNVFPIDARDRLGLTATAWAVILAVNGAMILGGQTLLSNAVRRFHKPFIVAAGVSCWAVGFAVLGLAPSAEYVFPTLVLMTLGEMLVFPIQPAVVADLAPASARARYQGALTMGGSIGNAIGPAVAGFAIAQLGGGWWLTVGAGLILLGLGYVAFGRVILPQRTAAPETQLAGS